MHDVINKKIFLNLILNNDKSIHYLYKIYKSNIGWFLINLYIYYKNTNTYRKTYKFFLRDIFYHEYFQMKN